MSKENATPLLTNDQLLDSVVSHLNRELRSRSAHHPRLSVVIDIDGAHVVDATFVYGPPLGSELKGGSDGLS